MDNKKVKALLLSWNPKNPEWNYKEAYFKVKNGEKSETDWRTKRTDGVEEKTEVFLIKLGDEAVLTDLKFVTKEELKKMTVYPNIKENLLKLMNGEKVENYLGSLWNE